MSEQELVKTCLAEILKVNGYLDLHLLAQRDFEFISNEIESKTGTIISVSTLKRLLRGDFARIPQTATLNAISNYLGYKNWQDFKLSKQSSGKIPSYHSTDNGDDLNQTIKPKKKSRLITSSFVITGVLFMTIVISLSLKNKNGNYHKAQFSARKTTANQIPNTVIFEYNIDDVDADSFFIQQSWDRNRRVQVFKNTYTLTDVYYEPGYHKAKLIADDSIIKTVDVSIPTDQWFFYAKENKPKSIPAYINADPDFFKGSLSIKEDELIRSHINTKDVMDYIYVYFPSKIEFSSDDFVLTARLRMNEVRNNFCPSIMTEVFCQDNFMYVTTTPPGCSGESAVQFCDAVFSGRKNDLSGLSIEVREWFTIELIVNNRQVTLSLNDKKIFSTAYQNSAGLITGLGFISNGLCEIDYVSLKGNDGTVVYENAFDPLN